MKIIAITGSIASGKSTVSRMLAEYYPVISSDDINRDLLENSAQVKEEVIAAFGSEVISKNEIDRSKLSKIVFAATDKKERLEAIMHPRILEVIMAFVSSSTADFVFVEVPLLFEVNWQQYFDYSVVVVADEKLLLERLRKRGISKNAAVMRLQQQLPQAEKIRNADYVIENNSTLEELQQKVLELLQKLKGR